MKKVFSILFFVSIFQFHMEATNPFEELKKQPTLNQYYKVVKEGNLKEQKDLERVQILFCSYCDQYTSLPFVKKLDLHKEDGIRQILNDIEQIRERDAEGNILVFFDIDRFIFWKDGFTLQQPLSQENINNFYEKEEHKSLFRDCEFPYVMEKLKELGCVIYGLTARHSAREKYEEIHFSRIKKDFENLQQLIKFSSFPKRFKYTGIERQCEDLQNFIDFDSFSQNNQYSQFFLHNLSEKENAFTPLIGYSGIFSTNNKLEAINFLVNNREKIDLFSWEQNPAHIIYGDDWGGNLIGNIPKNVICYHWPYAYKIANIFLPYVELHKNGQEAFVHLVYVLGSHPKLREFIVTNLLKSTQKDNEDYANCIKAILNDIIFKEKNAFLNFVEKKYYNEDLKEINAILNYLKWENEGHQEIQKYLLENVLTGCILEIAKNIYHHKVKEFFDNLDENDYMNLISNNVMEKNTIEGPQLGDSPQMSPHPQQESLSEEISQDRIFREQFGEFLKKEIVTKNYNFKINDFDSITIPENKKIEIIYKIVDHFKNLYYL